VSENVISPRLPALRDAVAGRPRGAAISARSL
jgi:hypothetical protein